MMNIQPNIAAASIAGTTRAAARGGEADSQAADATNKQSTKHSPAGKSAESSAVDAGEQTGDRGGDGRQVYDRFESSEEKSEHSENDGQQQDQPPDASSGHIDFSA